MPKITKTYSEEEIITALITYYKLPETAGISMKIGKECRGQGMSEYEVIVFQGAEVEYCE